jgi:predicted short-subunit dehydrogenase-like oxidoreductase (DUF2520 family)
MRELERDLSPTPTPEAPTVIVGRGKVGSSLARALRVAGVPVRVSASEEAAPSCAGATAALLCVPDDAIAAACEEVAAAEPPPALVGHVSGASTLEVLAPAVAAGSATFSLHPLQTFADDRTSVQGMPCAIAGSDADAEEFAAALAERLQMRYFGVPEERRAAYHAAASIASNFLVALEESAAELLERTGAKDARGLLAPLVLRTAANWSEQGAEALTGPIARGDRATVERQREALAELAPELLPLYEAMAERTERVGGASPEEIRA